MCSILGSNARLELYCNISDFAEVLEEQCPVVQESWDDEAEGEQGYWKDITHHMSDKLSNFTNQSLIWCLHKDLVYW